MNPPAWQADRRAGMMDEEGIDISILYPSIGLTLPRIEDGELSAAHCRGLQQLDPRLLLPGPGPSVSCHHPAMGGRAIDRAGDEEDVKGSGPGR